MSPNCFRMPYSWLEATTIVNGIRYWAAAAVHSAVIA